MAVDYKIKYLDLRSKFMKTAERMYRMGKEDGLKEGQMQAQQEQAAQAAQEAALAAQGGEPQIDPETGEIIEPQAQELPPEAFEQGQEEVPQSTGFEDLSGEDATELDSRIGELEQLVAKGEKPKVTDLRKVILELSELRKSQKQLKPSHKEVVVSKQKELVDSVLKKWEKQANTKNIMDNLEDIVQSEGIEIK